MHNLRYIKNRVPDVRPKYVLKTFGINYKLGNQRVRWLPGSQKNVFLIASISHNGPEWYAMSAPYRREIKARELFESHGLECFVPMIYRIVDCGNGSRKRRLYPAISNLIFVRAERENIQHLKQRHGIVQYLTRPRDGRNIPITVPDKEMDSFRNAVENSLHNCLIFRPGEIDLCRGRRVRIIGGPLSGCEGVFMKVKGSRSRRLVVAIESLGAIAVEVEPDYIELI